MRLLVGLRAFKPWDLVQSEEAVEHVAADSAQHVEGVVEVAQEHDAAVAGDESDPWDVASGRWYSRLSTGGLPECLSLRRR